MQGLVLNGRQIGLLQRLVDSDDDEVTITFVPYGHNSGLHAVSTAREGMHALFDPVPELPAHAIQPVSQPRR